MIRGQSHAMSVVRPGPVRLKRKEGLQRVEMYLAIPDLDLGDRSLDAALDLVFGGGTLASVHGASLTGTLEFVNGTRQFSFDVDVTGVPSVVMKLFCGGPTMRVTTLQTMVSRGADEWQITNKIKLHVIGAELLAIEPVFWLHRDAEHCKTTMGGGVKHAARLPPPLRWLAVKCMAAHSTSELEKFKVQIDKRMTVDLHNAVCGPCG